MCAQPPTAIPTRWHHLLHVGFDMLSLSGGLNINRLGPVQGQMSLRSDLGKDVISGESNAKKVSSTVLLSDPPPIWLLLHPCSWKAFLHPPPPLPACFLIEQGLAELLSAPLHGQGISHTTKGCPGQGGAAGVCAKPLGVMPASLLALLSPLPREPLVPLQHP